ncbi:MAG TPA: M20/M25/M40 family metallo-hydrolase [Candidatus Eisenbacteria bacterium]|nr:M20/M25/M40 family metallo-hydrolase [Candidatus Eisenbacteria bacterium]
MTPEPDRMPAVERAIESRLERNLEELGRLVAQPSIAAQNVGMDACAELAAGMLRERGFSVDFPRVPGFPVIVAERPGASDRTLLIYNHYDVQPPEPLELWTSPPFEATRRGDRLIARGVSDDKGHFTARLLAIDALLAERGELPCRILWVLEGEEEIGSPNLPAFVRDHKERLAGDGCLWEFGYVDPGGVPVLHAGLRGICYVELSVETAARDAHSGVGGSIFPNAAWRLTWALASLKGPDERIRIPGHSDAVRPPSARDRELMEAMPETAEEYRELYGVKQFLRGLEGGAELRIAEVFEPTCTICGLDSGYQGAGSKTVLPARATAKVDFRLVPDQTPAEVLQNLRAHLDREGFPDVAIRFLGGNPAGRTDPDHPFLRLVAETAIPAFGVPMRIVPMIGGSGPNESFIRYLGVPVATAGFGYPDTRAHAPDENLLVSLYVKHAKHAARLIDAFARDS